MIIPMENNGPRVRLLQKKQPFWLSLLWLVLFGLSIWSYGFNNIPLIRPLPIVDALVPLIVLWSLPRWWRYLRIPVARKLLILIGLLSLIVILRLVIDFPQYGLLAARDALFASELWIVFPSIAAGYLIGNRGLHRHLFWLFSLSTAWFLLYPFRESLTALSPIVGVQRPVPLFAWTTAGFISVPAFFWFLFRLKGLYSFLGASACLLVFLFTQGRGTYLAFFLTLLASVLLKPRTLPRWGRIGIVVALTLLLLFLIGPLPGRLGEPIGFQTVIAQLQTLLGEEGPGSGSYWHRLEAWPRVITEVMNEPYGWLIGVGLGRDLFMGFTVGPNVFVRKPHNDFLEVWARIGIFGLIVWISLIITVVTAALQGFYRTTQNLWIFALQITMLITSFAQPALGFAYTTVVWIGLTGLWLGAELREQKNARSSSSHPLPTARG